VQFAAQGSLDKHFGACDVRGLYAAQWGAEQAREQLVA
jgi:hypothetical protein